MAFDKRLKYSIILILFIIEASANNLISCVVIQLYEYFVNNGLFYPLQFGSRRTIQL
jgi:hypothetical protein